MGVMIDFNIALLNKTAVRTVLFLFAFLASLGVPASAQIGALQTDCTLGGPLGKRGYQFVPTCSGQAQSPDGQFAIVQHSYTTKQPPIELQDSRGRVIAKIPALTDGMPFAVFWSPRPDWFLVNHHVGSFMDRPEVYEIRRGRVIQHEGMTREARKQAIRISPCLGAVPWNFVRGEAEGWSSDGKRIAWYFETDTDACMGPHELGAVPPNKQWKAFWMISDAASGRIVPGSIRIIPDDKTGYSPQDAMYAEYRRTGL